MLKVCDKKLDEICGGATSISGTVISAINEVIKTLFDAGVSLGSSFRRIKEDELCPLE